MKTRTLIGLCVVGGALLPPKASAIEISAGTSVYSTLRSCVAGVTACDSITAPAFIEQGGLPGNLASSAFVTAPGYGVAYGSAALSGEIGAPILKGYAHGEVGKRTMTTAVAVQRYTYSGSETITRTFGGVLTYSQYATGDYGLIGSGINAVISVFKLSADSFDAGTTERDNYDALLGGGLELADGFSTLGSDQHMAAALSTDAGFASLQVNVTLNPGDTVWVRAVIQTPGTNGGWVDASHTFVTQWNDATALAPASMVPEPGTLAFMTAGLLLLAGVSRQRVL